MAIIEDELNLEDLMKQKALLQARLGAYMSDNEDTQSPLAKRSKTQDKIEELCTQSKIIQKEKTQTAAAVAKPVKMSTGKEADVILLDDSDGQKSVENRNSSKRKLDIKEKDRVSSLERPRKMTSKSDSSRLRDDYRDRQRRSRSRSQRRRLDDNQQRQHRRENYHKEDLRQEINRDKQRERGNRDDYRRSDLSRRDSDRDRRDREHSRRRERSHSRSKQESDRRRHERNERESGREGKGGDGRVEKDRYRGSLSEGQKAPVKDSSSDEEINLDIDINDDDDEEKIIEMRRKQREELLKVYCKILY